MDLSWLENIIIGILVFAIILGVDRMEALAELSKATKAIIAAIFSVLAVIVIDLLI
ncbi:MAG: hypothetical protein AAGF54_17135 [Pseudomonadota bacterium]